jgi:hypothetical protein
MNIRPPPIIELAVPLVTLWTGGEPISFSLISLLMSAILNYFFTKNCMKVAAF